MWRFCPSEQKKELLIKHTNTERKTLKMKKQFLKEIATFTIACFFNKNGFILTGRISFILVFLIVYFITDSLPPFLT